MNSPKRTLVFATNNAHKLAEIQYFLGDQFELKTLAAINCVEELPETHETIPENSLEKANYLYQNYNVDCFADDSGLEVEALNGAPGVYSAMYAGPQRSHADNIKLLLNNLENQTNRNAQFRSVISLIIDGQSHQFEGIVKGQITETLHGEGGFGYDPVFRPHGSEKTFGQMTMEEKNADNHRTKAMAKLLLFLERMK
jgi:XTP/dITP diphosphohydrolase